MAIICRSIGLLFIMVPRTGCTAVGRALRTDLGGEFLPPSDIMNARGSVVVPRKHCTLGQLIDHEVLTAEEAASLLKVACIRNPFDSLVSLYSKRRNVPDERLDDPSYWLNQHPKRDRLLAEVRYCRTHTFNQWIRKEYLPLALLATLGFRRHTMFERFADGVDVIMRFEHLQEDLMAVIRRLGVSRELTVPVFNRTPGRTPEYRSYYAKVSRKIVEMVFRPDLARGGYRF